MSTESIVPPERRRATLIEALVPVLCLIAFLSLAVLNLDELPEIAVLSAGLRALAKVPGLGSLLFTSVPVQIPLVAATVVAVIAARRLGYRWAELQEAMLDGIRLSLGAILILMVVGMLIGTWIAGGIVPLMVSAGLKLLAPGVFLPATCLICAVVSLVTGSSWTTAGTVGIALIGVGTGLGFPLPLVAGAIISGAYFGDKMSPLSDTTNLAPGVAGVELFEHVRHMIWTSGPSLVIALVGYVILGRAWGGGAADVSGVEAILSGVEGAFALPGWLWLGPLVVLGLVIAKVPALPALVAGVVVGVIAAVVAQGSSLGAVLVVAYDGFAAATGNEAVDALLSRGGLSSMYGTIGLIVCAMCFGGVMERAGFLERLAQAILSLAKGRGGLVTATLGTCMGMNVVAADQYLAIVVPGRMFRAAYGRAGLHPKNLSRALEDAGTITSPLVPWNTCGAYMFATLGVFPLAYLPFAFFNLVSPLVSVVLGYTGWTMTPATAGGAEQAAEAGRPAV